MRAAVYLRVSRSDQSSAMQLDETSQYVQQRGWSLLERFVDDGASGATDRRPGFRAMLEAARRRRFNALVVYRSDRLFRGVRELLATLDELAELGIAFVSLHEAWDTTTASGRAMLQMVGVFAEFERNVLRERTRSGLEAARRRGKRLGRPRRAVDVDIVRALRGRGMAWAAIARELGISEATLYRCRPRSPVA